MPLINIYYSLIDFIKKVTCRINAHRNNKISEKCETRFEEELDIVNILKNLRDLKSMKSILTKR
jgi:hypothetical protein